MSETKPSVTLDEDLEFAMSAITKCRWGAGRATFSEKEADKTLLLLEELAELRTANKRIQSAGPEEVEAHLDQIRAFLRIQATRQKSEILAESHAEKVVRIGEIRNALRSQAAEIVELKALLREAVECAACNVERAAWVLEDSLYRKLKARLSDE